MNHLFPIISSIEQHTQETKDLNVINVTKCSFLRAFYINIKTGEEKLSGEFKCDKCANVFV